VTATVPGTTIIDPRGTTTEATVTVSLPGETTTAPGTTTVVTVPKKVTVTGPTQIVRGGVLGKKTARVTLTTPCRIIRVAGRV
jgi:hypothetical protein